MADDRSNTAEDLVDATSLRITQFVYFALWSDTTSAAVITETLGLTPDASWIRGAVRDDPPVPVSHKWALECRDRDLGISEQVTHVLTRVRPVAAQIGQLVEHSVATACLHVVRYFDAEDGAVERTDVVDLPDGDRLTKLAGQHQSLGWHLESDDLSLLARLRAGIDVDEYN